MSTCWYCGEEIDFCYKDGRLTPIHKNGGWCQSDNVSNESDSGSRIRVDRVHTGNNTFNSSFEEYCRKTICPECGDEVFFIRHNGGSVWVDSLGWPWPKHPCMDATEEPSWYCYFKSKQPVDGDERLFSGVIVDSVWQPANENEPSQIILAIDGGEQGRVVLSTAGTSTADYFKRKIAIVNFSEESITVSSHDVIPIINASVDPGLIGKPSDWATQSGSG